MKITKEMGMACLRDLAIPFIAWNGNALVADAVKELGWCDFDAGVKEALLDGEDHWFTALAMCAAIAGVKPE